VSSDTDVANLALIPPGDEQAFTPSWPEGVPQPGFYPASEISPEAYRAIKAVNASALQVGAEVTALHMRAELDGLLKKRTKAKSFGSAFHGRLLEPATFAERFHVTGSCGALVKSGPRAGQPCGDTGRFQDRTTGLYYCGSHAKGRPELVEQLETITAAELAQIEYMRTSIFAHEVVSMIRREDGSETTVIVNRDGYACKARLDKLVIDSPHPEADDIILDLKSMQACGGTDRRLGRDIPKYGYDLAAYWYVDLVHRLRPDKKRPWFAWVFAEKEYPFAVRVVLATKWRLEIGGKKCEHVWENYVWCMKHNTWPGYPGGLDELEPTDRELEHYHLGG